MDIEKDAKELLAKAKQQRLDTTLKSEARDADPDPSPEKEKTKEDGDVEEQLEKDEEILSKKDEDLDEAEKNRKVELAKVKVDAEDKTKKSNVQKRFDELTGKIKELENDRTSTQSERNSLKAELDGIKKKLSMTPQDEVKEKVKSELLKRRDKYLEEDRELPREERREMTQEELDDWSMEDQDAVHEWKTRRVIRKSDEERDIKVDIEQTSRAEIILNKQLESARRTYAKHPELNIEARRVELMKSGKTKEETHKILCSENPKFKAVAEIYMADSNKYVLAENAPEMVVEEMEKRLGKPSGKASDEVEELKKRIAAQEAEIESLKNLDADVGSERQVPSKTLGGNETDKVRDSLAREVGLDPKKIKERMEWRKKNVR